MQVSSLAPLHGPEVAAIASRMEKTGHGQETLGVRVWRGVEDGAFAEYRVPARANQTVLDVVT